MRLQAIETFDEINEELDFDDDDFDPSDKESIEEKSCYLKKNKIRFDYMYFELIETKVRSKFIFKCLLKD